MMEDTIYIGGETLNYTHQRNDVIMKCGVFEFMRQRSSQKVVSIRILIDLG